MPLADIVSRCEEFEHPFKSCEVFDPWTAAAEARGFNAIPRGAPLGADLGGSEPYPTSKADLRFIASDEVSDHIKAGVQAQMQAHVEAPMQSLLAAQAQAQTQACFGSLESSVRRPASHRSIIPCSRSCSTSRCKRRRRIAL